MLITNITIFDTMLIIFIKELLHKIVVVFVFWPDVHVILVLFCPDGHMILVLLWLACICVIARFVLLLMLFAMILCVIVMQKRAV